MELSRGEQWSYTVPLHTCRSPRLSNSRSSSSTTRMDTSQPLSPTVSNNHSLPHSSSSSSRSSRSCSMALDGLSMSRVSLSSPSPSPVLSAEASAQTFSSGYLSPTPIPGSPPPTPCPPPHLQGHDEVAEQIWRQMQWEAQLRPAACGAVQHPAAHLWAPQPETAAAASAVAAAVAAASLPCTARPSTPTQATPTPNPTCKPGVVQPPRQHQRRSHTPSSPTPPACPPPPAQNAHRAARASAPDTGTPSPTAHISPPAVGTGLSPAMGAQRDSCTRMASPPDDSSDSSDSAAAPRAALVVLLHELSVDFHLQQETLFNAVSMLDRYLLALATAPPPRNVLQLVALACIYLAAKKEESFPQPTAHEWVATTDYAYTTDNLLSMEHYVTETLGWQLQCPTAYSYLHLLCHGLASCSVTTICVATYLVELSLFDAVSQRHGHMQTAVAALLLAHLQSHSSASALNDAIAGLVAVDAEAVRGCASRLVQLHCNASREDGRSAAVGEATGPAGGVNAGGVGGGGGGVCASEVALVREKFSRPEWMCVSLYPLVLGR
ncbi:MAG: hypothetical protein WDW36_001051 [Sanguina aurantia]